MNQSIRWCQVRRVGSTTDDEPKKFRSLTEVYVDTFEEELDLDELVLFAIEEPTTYHEGATETTW